MPNSEIIQKFETCHLPDDEFDGMGQAAMLANVEYYQALADQARASHREYLAAVDIWQNKLNKISKTLD